MKFSKMHGLGNDYVYVDATKTEISDPSRISIFVSDRHFGIGSDGLILIKSSEVADFEMEMYNADGSQGKMCGNGIRCVAKYVYDKGLCHKDEISVNTLAGIKYLKLGIKDDQVESVRVDMGSPSLIASQVPVTFPKEKMINEPMEVKGEIYHVTCVSMGNPHCVLFLNDDIRKLNLPEIGPSFENHPTFPERINTEFCNIIDRGHIRMRVWERGSGETLACGTGACAVAVAGFVNGLTDSKVDIELRGGHLQIEYDEKADRVYMTGPATFVFDGEIDIPKDFDIEDMKIY